MRCKKYLLMLGTLIPIKFVNDGDSGFIDNILHKANYMPILILKKYKGRGYTYGWCFG